MNSEMDIQKFAEKLARAGREAVAWEQKKLQWILEEKAKLKQSESNSAA